MNLSTRKMLSANLKEFGLKILTGNYLFIKMVIKREFKYLDTDKILDLGCGTGILAPLFPEKNYIGIDIDIKLIEVAKRLHKNYEFIRMDSSNLTLVQNSFDKILIVGVIHHLDNTVRKKTFTLLKKLLKKNGTILAIEAIPPIFSFNILGKILRDHDEGHHIVSMKEYEKAFSSYFQIKKAYQQIGGILDYGVFVLKNKL